MLLLISMFISCFWLRFSARPANPASPAMSRFISRSSLSDAGLLAGILLVGDVGGILGVALGVVAGGVAGAVLGVVGVLQGRHHVVDEAVLQRLGRGEPAVAVGILDDALQRLAGVLSDRSEERRV